jgi:Virulence-associated protein E
MSAYKQEASMQRRGGRPRKAQPPRIIPHAIMKPQSRPDGTPFIEAMPGEEARKFANSLRNNSGTAIKALGALLNPDPPYKFERIESVTEITNPDGSIIFYEIRIVRQTASHAITPSVVQFPENPTKLNKEYKHIYKGDKIWPLTDEGQEHTDRWAWCSTSSVLMQAGLFKPTNSHAALELLKRYRNELDDYNRRLSAFKASQSPTYEPTDVPATFPEAQPPTPVFIWTEGEKSRIGVESYLDTNDPEILALLEEYNVDIVTLGVLAGEPGARGTNYTLRPYSNDYIIKGVNDEYLELPLALHIYARDNDDEGRTEANITAQSLIKLGVPPEQVRIANPPLNALPKWDDGDQLPPGMTPAQRLKQILDAPSTIGQYTFRAKGKGEEIDPTNRNNKRLAVQRISKAMFDETSTGERHFVIAKSGETLSAADYMYLAEMCLEEMGHPPTDNLLNEKDWKPVFSSRFPNPIESRNFIYEEVMRDIEKGQFQLAASEDKEQYNPETYLIDGFNLPNTPRNRLISKVIIRDYVAVTLRPYLEHNPVIPQMMLILYADEGIGKSEFCKVLAGGKPGPESFHARYSNSVDIRDLQSILDRGSSAFANKAKCKTILEFQDKALGDSITVAQNGLLNDLANMSQVEFRVAYGKIFTSFPRQFLTIFTTNREDLIGHNMGHRRWIIVDLNQSMKGFAKRSSDLRNMQMANAQLTEEELMIARGHNPGIQKNYDKRAATLAYMYNSDEWKGTLVVPPELRQDLEEERRKFSSLTSWELILEEMLTNGELATETRMVVSSSIIKAIKDALGANATVSPSVFGRAMTRLGYHRNHKEGMRGWSKAEQPASLVSEYSVFTDPPYGRGHWITTTDPKGYLKKVDREVFG